MFYNQKYNCIFENTPPNSNICLFLIIDSRYERLIIAEKEKFIDSINSCCTSGPINYFIDSIQRYEYNSYGIYSIEKNNIGKLLQDFLELSLQRETLTKSELELTDKIFNIIRSSNDEIAIKNHDLQREMHFFRHAPNILIKYKWLLLTDILNNNPSDYNYFYFRNAFKYLSCLYNDLSIILPGCLLESFKFNKKYSVISFYSFLNSGYIEPLIQKYSHSCEIMYSKSNWPVKYLTSKGDIITLLLYYAEQLILAGFCIKLCRNCKSIIICHQKSKCIFCSSECYKKYNRESKRKHDEKVKNDKNENAYKNFDQYLRRLENKLKAKNISANLVNSFKIYITSMRKEAKLHKQKIDKGIISDDGYLGELELNKNDAFDMYNDIIDDNSAKKEDK